MVRFVALLCQRLVLTSRLELPEYTPGAAYRIVELLLGRISSLSQTGDFTTQTGNYTGTTPLLKREGYGHMIV